MAFQRDPRGVSYSHVFLDGGKIHDSARIRKVFPIHIPSQKASFPEKHFNFLESCKVFPIHLFPIHGGGKVLFAIVGHDLLWPIVGHQ